MENQEREQLGQFLLQLGQARAGRKDDEADAMIREACARQPDAAYLLVQRAMLLEHAVNDARTQIARLQQELIAAQASATVRAQNQGGGFLQDGNAWGRAPSAPAAQAYPPSAAYPAPLAMAAAPAQPAWGGSLLGTVASTAVGVAAGSFLFQGIENLIGGQHGGGWFGNGGQGLSAGETVINKDYDSSPMSAPANLATPDDFGSSGNLEDLGPGDDWA